MLTRFWAWVTSNPVPALTVAGIALFVILRLPYAVYYGLLGSSPEEVGLDYIELLARSTAGVTAVALAVGGVAGAVAFLVGLDDLNKTLALGTVLTLQDLLRPKSVLMDDHAYAAERAATAQILSKALPNESEKVELFLAARDEQRELEMTPDRNRQEKVRLLRLRLVAPFRLLLFSGARARRKAWWLATRAAFTASFMAIVGLPVAAYVDATAVRDCTQPILGRIGLFAVNGAQVTVSRLSEDGTQRHVAGADRRTVYLGSGKDRVVLYDCDRGRTIRLPAEGLVVTTES